LKTVNGVVADRWRKIAIALIIPAQRRRNSARLCKRLFSTLIAIRRHSNNGLHGRVRATGSFCLTRRSPTSRLFTNLEDTVLGSINGTGTVVYGKRDFLTDGSFVTTKWVSFLWVPLFPLSSMRVRTSSTDTPMPDHLLASLLLAVGGLLAFKFSGKYIVQSKRRPVLLQVLYVYAFVFALGFGWWNLSRNTNVLSTLFLCAVLATPCVLRAVARSRAAEPSHEALHSDASNL